MMPFTPMNDDFERVVEGLEEGEPEGGAPAESGGIGADTLDLTPAERDLKQEGVLDEENDPTNKSDA